MRRAVATSFLALLLVAPACAQQPAVIDGPLTINGNFKATGTAQMGGVSVERQLTLQGNVFKAPNLPSAAPAQHCAIWVNNGVLNRTVCP